MPTLTRKKTGYKGVFYIDGTDPATGKPEKIFNIRYRKAGKMIEEKAGRQSQDMTSARADSLRAARMHGKEPSRQEVREQREAAKKAELPALIGALCHELNQGRCILRKST